MVSESYKDSKLFYANRSKHLASSNFYETAEHTDEKGEEWEDTEISGVYIYEAEEHTNEKIKLMKIYAKKDEPYQYHHQHNHQ